MTSESKMQKRKFVINLVVLKNIKIFSSLKRYSFLLEISISKIPIALKISKGFTSEKVLVVEIRGRP